MKSTLYKDPVSFSCSFTKIQIELSLFEKPITYKCFCFSSKYSYNIAVHIWLDYIVRYYSSIPTLLYVGFATPMVTYWQTQRQRKKNVNFDIKGARLWNSFHTACLVAMKHSFALRIQIASWKRYGGHPVLSIKDSQWLDFTSLHHHFNTRFPHVYLLSSISLPKYTAAVTSELKKRAKQTKRVYIARTAVTRKLFGFHVTAVRACLFV